MNTEYTYQDCRSAAEIARQANHKPQGNKAQHSKQVVPDPVPSVLNQWTLDPEIYGSPSGQRFQGNAVTSGGKIIGKLVGFGPKNTRLIVASVNHADKLAEALRALRQSIRHAHNCKAPQAFPCSCDADTLWRESEAVLKAYEAARGE